MSRRGEIESDSLELLLDTICNMFGGIVFISLLVVVMLQSSQPIVSSRNGPPIDPSDIDLLQDDLRNSSLTVERLRQLRSQYVQVIRQQVPDDLEDRVDELENLTDTHSAVEGEALELSEDNTERSGKISSDLARIANAQAEVAAARDELEDLRIRKKAAVATRSDKLPNAQRMANLEGVQVSLCRGRFYVRHEWKNGNQIGPNFEDYFVTEETDGFHVRPKPLGGIPLDDRDVSREQVLARLKGFSNTKYKISITVWPDTFDSFHRIRTILADAGYRYTFIVPTTQIRDRGGADRLAL